QVATRPHEQHDPRVGRTRRTRSLDHLVHEATLGRLVRVDAMAPEQSGTEDQSPEDQAAEPQPLEPEKIHPSDILASPVEHAGIPPERIAAFFDVDNTIIRGASAFHLARGLYNRGFFSIRDLLIGAWHQWRYVV